MLVTSEAKAKELGVKPLAKIVAYGDAATKPVDFTLAPSLVIPKVRRADKRALLVDTCTCSLAVHLQMLKAAGLKMEDISLFEINEAFSVVVLVTIK